MGWGALRGGTPEGFPANGRSLAGAPWERERVAALRARGVPWAHIAAQLGRCEATLRQVYDRREHPVRAAQAEPPPALRGIIQPRPGGLKARIILALAAGAESRAVVGRMVGCNPDLVSTHLTQLARGGLARMAGKLPGKGCAHRWLITDRGRRAAMKART